MGTFRRRLWSRRGKLGGVAFWALLAVAAAAGEIYDELPPEDVDLEPYQEMNSLDTGAPVKSEQLEDRLLAREDDLLLWKLIRSLKPREQPRENNRSTWNSNHQTPIRNSHQNIADLGEKDRLVKRITELEQEGEDEEHMFRPQRKWKIKKGKAIGSQMVCYFKLCAFRSPA